MTELRTSIDHCLCPNDKCVHIGKPLIDDLVWACIVGLLSLMTIVFGVLFINSRYAWNLNDNTITTKVFLDDFKVFCSHLFCIVKL